MTDTTRLGLPQIEAAQAQKHVTHNEALGRLDALIHLSVNGRLAAPPTTIPTAARYLVSAGASGAFALHTNDIAVWQDGGWTFITPKAGWRAFAQDDGSILVFDGTAWRDIGAGIRTLDGLTRLGLGTSADATNPLAVKANNTLFAARAVSEGGTGDLRCKFNKEASGKTASQLFQTNWSGRAEAGLIGNDHYQIKVSLDGAAWNVALDVDPATGNVGLGAAPIAPFKLDVSSSARVYGTIAVSGGYGIAWPALAFNTVYDGNGSGGFRAFNNGYAGCIMLNQASGAMEVMTGGAVMAGAAHALTTRLAIASSGNVGINQVSPAATLDVAGSARLGSLNSQTHPNPTAAGGMHVQWNYVAGAAETDFYNLYSGAGLSFRFWQSTGAGTAQPLCDMAPGYVSLYATGSQRLVVEPGTTRPAVDNAYTLGAGSYRWAALYAATGTINTSDAREKTDITELPEVLPLLRKLRPVSYRWKFGGADTVRREVTETVREQATEDVALTQEEIEFVDGRAVLRTRTVTEKRPLFDDVPVFDEAGAPVFDDMQTEDAEGRPCAMRRPRMVQSPRMIEVERTRTQEEIVERPGRRVHLGLIAQEVKAVADSLGIDFAAYVYDEESDRHGLRYDQMIAPLIKGVQELDAAVGALSARVAALESKAR